MRSKRYNGNSPLQGNRLEGKKGVNTSDAFARTETEISKRTPRQSMTSGSLATPNGVFHAPKRFQKATADSTAPWRVRISSDGGDPATWTASVTEGEIVDAINSVTKLTFEEGEDFSVAVVEDDVVCIKYNYSDGAITIDVLNDGESPNQFTPIIDDGGDPATVTGSLYPLAKIINTADPADDPVLTVRQLARSNLKKTTVCINGNALTTFGPI